ncbi:Polysaccharide biosynthesis protein [Caprobacter fermentans]|uniref:Polysaccharide biosynthesis protein n=1 Tax=Caproicibacter fermentans TaxID=2576756 RepID=A0A6N8HZ31_9FIRM|nr:oligosaccharide flippase family protein [Caproicibacter fermentans]MVB10737.1 Polysaccharide biosynthesis protein [Caproicibacter fermentans]
MNARVSQRKAGVILSYATMAAQSVIAIAYTPVMLRLLGKSEYGVYNLVYSMVSYLGVLSFGFDSAYIRFYSRLQAKKDVTGMARLNGMFLTLFTLISILALSAGSVLVKNAGSLLSGGLTDREIKIAAVLMKLMVFNIAITFPTSVFDSIVMIHEQYIFQKTVNLLRTVLNPFLALPLLLMGYRSISLVVVTTALNVAGLLINIWFCLSKLKTQFIFSRFHLALLREIWIFSAYIFLNMVTEQANWSVDKIILGKMKGSSEVAVYSIGSQFNTIYLSFSTAISSVFVPKVNRMVAEHGDIKSLTNLFTKVGRFQFFVLSFILTGFAFFGGYFIKVWAGREYAGTYLTAYHIALLLMVPVTIPLIQNLGIEIQIAKNMHKFRSVVYALIAAVNLTASILLCPSLGGVGCAAATAASITLGSGFMMNWYYQSRVGLDILFFWKQILKTFPALILPAAFGFCVTRFFPVDSAARFSGVGLLYSVLFFFSVWEFGLNAYEKGLILQPFQKFVKNPARPQKTPLPGKDKS